MSEDRRRILDLLEQGKITADEAERLLDAIEQPAAAGRPGDSAAPLVPTSKPKYLRVIVDDGDEHVNVRVPLQLIRAGVKLGSIIPEHAQSKLYMKLGEKGIDFSNLKPEMIEDLVDGMAELAVEVNDGDEHVRVFCE